MPTIVRRTPQHTVAMEAELWQKARRIAARRHEKVSDVLRRATLEYVEKYEHLDTDHEATSKG